jgi:hypothetical protein
MTDRDANGRFVKGSTGNPTGRAPKAREERYYEITMSTVSFDDWKVIVEKARDQAKKGDPVARKWLADYLVGVPDQNLNINGQMSWATFIQEAGSNANGSTNSQQPA